MFELSEKKRIKFIRPLSRILQVFENQSIFRKTRQLFWSSPYKIKIFSEKRRLQPCFGSQTQNHYTYMITNNQEYNFLGFFSGGDSVPPFYQQNCVLPHYSVLTGNIAIIWITPRQMTLACFFPLTCWLYMIGMLCESIRHDERTFLPQKIEGTSSSHYIIVRSHYISLYLTINSEIISLYLTI